MTKCGQRKKGSETVSGRAPQSSPLLLERKGIKKQRAHSEGSQKIRTVQNGVR